MRSWPQVIARQFQEEHGELGVRGEFAKVEIIQFSIPPTRRNGNLISTPQGCTVVKLSLFGGLPVKPAPPQYRRDAVIFNPRRVCARDVNAVREPLIRFVHAARLSGVGTGTATRFMQAYPVTVKFSRCTINASPAVSGINPRTVQRASV
ncbi:hypothetical protein EVAR_4893_1 [Eumeta japonica]|uniref:Uncharacterized protein n=1 Tax=Eumeta variegata TaxID=151549 RepID=A0A4C1SZC9_EUMVA|nr:hypothetical protein EVAR_4893_1 [Eumeta japonica]